MRYPPGRTRTLALAVAIGWAPLVPAEDGETPGSFEGSVEVLYRGIGTSGSERKFREDLDGLASGLRLADLVAHWERGRTAGADYFRLEAAGLGGDPHERLRLEAGKRGSYEVKLGQTRQAYLYDLFGLTGDRDASTWGGARSLTDLELTIHATEGIDVFFEYGENRREGTSLFVKDVQTDLFAMETPLDQVARRYSVGGRFTLGPVDLVVRQSLRRHDARFDSSTRGDQGLDTADAVTLTDYDWRQSDDGEADLTTLTLAAPLGERLRVRLAAFGTLIGGRELDSDATLDASGTTVGGAPFAIRGGVSRTRLDIDHLALDGDLIVRLSPTLDVLLQVDAVEREISGTQLRDLDGNGAADDTEGTVFDTTPGSTTREDYSRSSLTGLIDYAPTRKLRLRLGARRIERELIRSGFEFGTNDQRNERFESDGDEALVASISARPASWLDLSADYEEGDVKQALTAVAASESDRLRLRARLRPVDGLRFDLQHSTFETTRNGTDFRTAAACSTPGAGIEVGCWSGATDGERSAVTVWHRPHADFDYELRWARQDVDSAIRVRYDTELFFNSAENGASLYDTVSTQWSARANVRWADGAWRAFVRLLMNEADGRNALIGPAFDSRLAIGQDYLDLEGGLTRTFGGGMYFGARVRTFEYDDVRRQFSYDGDVLTLVAGTTF